MYVYNKTVCLLTINERSQSMIKKKKRIKGAKKEKGSSINETKGK